MGILVAIAFLVGIAVLLVPLHVETKEVFGSIYSKGIQKCLSAFQSV